MSIYYRSVKLAENYKGVVADYWKITSSIINYMSNKTIVTLSFYVSKTVREESLENTLLSRRCTLEGIYEDSADQYTQLKLTDNWKDATDA